MTADTPKVLCKLICEIVLNSLCVASMPQFTDLPTDWPPFGFLHPRGFFLGFPVQDSKEIEFDPFQVKVQGWVARADPHYNRTTSRVVGRFRYCEDRDRWEYYNRDIDFDRKDTFYYNVSVDYVDRETTLKKRRSKNFKIFIDNNTFYDYSYQVNKHPWGRIQWEASLIV